MHNMICFATNGIILADIIAHNVLTLGGKTNKRKRLKISEGDKSSLQNCKSDSKKIIKLNKEQLVF